MKFKYLIIAFSIIIVIIVLVTAVLMAMTLLPASETLGLSGTEPHNANGSFLEYAVNFRFLTFPLLMFMIILLGCMGTFFFFNYRLLSLLEREDWPALAYYLEQKIYVKGKYTNRNVRLLASSYLVITDYLSVLKLESKAMLTKPSVVDKNILLFGSARVLNGNPNEAVAFFKMLLEKGKSSQIKKKDEQWARWYYGFSHLLAGAFKLAQPEYIGLAISSDDALITGLSAYFLNNSISKYSDNPVDCLAAAEKGRARILKAIRNIEGWKREVEKMNTDIHIAIIRKYVDETGQWLFSDTLPK